MPPSRPLAFGLLLSVIAAAPLSAGASLRAPGHEFRPAIEERTAPVACTDANGVTAELVYRGHVDVEWHSSDGALVAGPYKIADYSAYFPYGCAEDGAVMVIVENKALVVDHDGPRGTAASICQNEPCSFYTATILSVDAGFLALWTKHGSALQGRFFAANGSPRSDQFVANDPLSGSYVNAVAAIRGVGGDAVIAWTTNSWPVYDMSVRATLLHGDGTSEDDVVLNEFPYGAFSDGIVITPAGPGEFVVAWSNADFEAGWVARRILADENVPTTTTTTTTTTLEQTSPDFLPAIDLAVMPTNQIDRPVTQPTLAADGGGHWITNWIDSVEEDWPGKRIFRNFFAESADDARRWASDRPVLEDEARTLAPSTVAINGAGVGITAWADRAGHTILFERSPDGGRSWSTPASLHAITDWNGYDHDQTVVSVRLTADDGGHWVASWIEEIWQEVAYEDVVSLEIVQCEIRSSLSTDDALTWQPARTIGDFPCGAYRDNDASLEVATDGAGNWLTLWIAGEVHASRSDDGGDTWSLPTTPLVIPGESPSSVAAAASHDGHWVVAVSAQHFVEWNRAVSRIFVSTSSDLAGAWSSPIGLEPWHDDDDGNDTAPTVAAGDTGQWGLAWESHEDVGNSGFDCDILVAFSGDDGASWSAPHPVDPEAGSDSRTDLAPQLVQKGGTWGLLWKSIEPAPFYNEPWRMRIRFARTAGKCGNGEPDAGEQCDDGNLNSGDGCDVTCVPTGCGSGVVTGDEECDDGNDDDTDECLSGCHFASCGDGAVLRDVEECDDANSIDTDGCISDCRLARCNDGHVREGVEECDQPESPSNNDECLSNCALARCGDGILHIGVEECDDGNVKYGDRCTKQCVLDSVCGPGPHVTTSEALVVLRKSVGLAVYCPMKRCDTNQDRRVTTADALQTLRFAVGLDLVDPCGPARTLVISIASNEKPAALQFVLDYLDAPGDILAAGTKPSCTMVVPGATSAIRVDQGRGFLIGAIIHLTGFQGPLDLIRCQYRSVADPRSGDFEFSIQDVSDASGHTIEPAPSLAVRIE